MLFSIQFSVESECVYVSVVFYFSRLVDLSEVGWTSASAGKTHRPYTCVMCDE